MTSLKLDRPLVFFDLEATGTDTQKDRIVSLYALKFPPCEEIQNVIPESFSRIFDPGIQMTPEVIAIHNITNEEAAKHGPFGASASELLSFVQGCDLGGFNLINFDVPMLWEEFARSGLKWDLAQTQILDVGNIFKKKEERTLAAGVKFYTGEEHGSAHNAAGDVHATVRVLIAQRLRYEDLTPMGLAELAAFSKMDDRMDLAGIIGRNANGEAVFSTKRNRGVRVVDDPGYAMWMLRSDFSEQTKSVIRGLLEGVAA